MDNYVNSSLSAGDSYPNVSAPDMNETENDSEFIEEIVSEYLWKIIPPFLLVIGVTGNILNIGVVRRLGISRQPTMVFICFLAVTDTVVLLIGLPRYWILYLLDYDLRTISSVGCKFFLFLIYISMQYSSWILVSLCIERLIKTYFPFRYRALCSVKKTVIVLIVELFVLCIVDMHFFWTNGVNDFTEGSCNSLTPEHLEFDEKVFVYIDFAFLSATPFLVMFISNVFILRALKRIQLNRVSMMHDIIFKRTERVSIKMTKMLVASTIYFLVATAPISVYFIVDSYATPLFEAEDNNAAIAKMDLAWSLTYLLQFSNYAVNFFLYTSVNKRFKTELRRLLRCVPKRTPRMSVYSTATSVNRGGRSAGVEETSTTEIDGDDPTSGGIELMNSSSDVRPSATAISHELSLEV